MIEKIRLKYRPLLIVATLLFPLSGLFYYMMAGYERGIDFARMELRGNVYQRPLEQLLKLVPEHKRASERLAMGDNAVASEVKALRVNIAQASSGVKDSNERVAQTATASKSIARDIAGISADVGDIRQGGERVKTSAVELSKLAEHLRVTVEQFKA